MAKPVRELANRQARSVVVHRAGLERSKLLRCVAAVSFDPQPLAYASAKDKSADPGFTHGASLEIRPSLQFIFYRASHVVRVFPSTGPISWLKRTRHGPRCLSQFIRS